MTCNPDLIAASNSSGVDWLRYTEGATSLESSLLSQSVLLAEREGFEPPEAVTPQRFSRPPPSTTRQPLQITRFFFWIEQNKTILYLLYEPLCLFFIKITKNYIFIYFCAIERNRTSTYWGFNPTTLPLSYDDIYHRFGTMVRTCTWNHYNLGSGVHHHFIGVLIKVAI